MPVARVGSEDTIDRVFTDDQSRFIESINIDDEIELTTERQHIVERHQLLGLLVSRHCQADDLDFPPFQSRTRRQSIAKCPFPFESHLLGDRPAAHANHKAILRSLAK